MSAAQARAALALVSPTPGTKPGTGAMTAPSRLPVSSTEPKLRILIAERRASAHSELSRRLDRVGHEVLARVTSSQGALDYAELLRPDVVLIAPMLEDGPGVMAAIALTRELPGVAAVVLSTHPAASNPAARPNWGAVALVPADAEPPDLDAELRRAVAQAREAAPVEVVPEQAPRSAEVRPADLAPAVAPTPQYQTPIPDLDAVTAAPYKAPGPAAIVVPLVPPRAVAPPVALVAPGVPQVELAMPADLAVPTRPQSPAVLPPDQPASSMAATAEQPRQRSPLSFTDEDLLAIGPALDADLPGAGRRDRHHGA